MNKNLDISYICMNPGSVNHRARKLFICIRGKKKGVIENISDQIRLEP